MPNNRYNLSGPNPVAVLDPVLELQASEDRFRELIENVHDVVWSVRFADDPLRSPATFVSPQSLEILGHHPDEFIEKPELWNEGVHPDDRPIVDLAIRRLAEGGTGQTRVYRFRHGRTGEYRWLEDRLSPRRNGAGDLVGLFGIARDISRRKRVELRERNRVAMLERIARGQSLPDLLEAIVRLVEDESSGALGSVLLLDKSGRHLLHGAAPRLPDFYNRAVHGVAIGPTVGSCGTAAFTGRRIVVEDIAAHPYWVPFRDLADKAGLRSCWSEPILSAAGDVLGTFAIYHDVAGEPSEAELETIANASNLASIAIERVRATESLRESEERFRVIFEQAAVGVAQREATTGQFVRVNERYCRILGRSEAEIRAIGFEVLTHPDDRAMSVAALNRVRAGETREYSLEKRYVRPDGGIRWVNLNASAIGPIGEPATTIIAVVEDITERKVAEEERRKLETQLRHAQKLESLGVMAGGIAHDFNNLLTGILGYCDLAQREVPPNSPAHDLLAEAVLGARQAADLTKQMLAYSGKGKFVVEPVAISTVVEDMARLLQVSISKKCALKFDFLPNLPSIEADVAQLRQVVMNLVINASEAIGDGSGLIALSTGVRQWDEGRLRDTYDDRFLPAGRYVHLQVSDSGSGMSEETKARIFDPFFTTKFTGRGLGLSAVLGILRGHHGTIQCQSELGLGTTFTAYFPASDRVAPVARPEVVGQWRGGGVALIVDDEESILGVARHMLTAMGFSVVTAADGRAALDVFQKLADPVRLVLLDMTMPQMDGEETFRELRRIQPDVRVVLSSGYNEQSAAGRFEGLGLAGFVQKPYRYDDLLKVVRRALDGPS